jgi:hypothetical protein
VCGRAYARIFSKPSPVTELTNAISTSKVISAKTARDASAASALMVSVFVNTRTGVAPLSNANTNSR